MLFVNYASVLCSAAVTSSKIYIIILNIIIVFCIISGMISIKMIEENTTCMSKLLTWKIVMGTLCNCVMCEE